MAQVSGSSIGNGRSPYVGITMKAGIDYIGVAVGAMIIDDKGQILLSKRSKGAKNERGRWEVPGGMVEFGEKLADAIRREIREELGVEIKILEQLPAADHIIPQDHQHWVPTTFLCNIAGRQAPRIMEPDKCDEIGWFALTNLPQPLSIITKIDLAWYKQKKNL